MPQAAAAAVVAWVGAVGAAASVVYAAVYIVVTMAINYGLNKLSQSLSGKRKTHGTGPARDVTVRGTVEPMQIINGEIKATGFLAFYGASGSANDYLHFVVCYAGHQCEDITDVWLDGRKVQDANIDGAGSVSTADFQDGGSASFGISARRIRPSTRSSTQRSACGERIIAARALLTFTIAC
jgi:hypothetical protein